MWPFTKYYSILDSGFFDGATDWHCHILPGVDDGIRTMESAIEVLDYYASTGIREVWLTPHIMEDVPNEPDALRTRFAELCATYEAHLGLPAGAVSHSAQTTTTAATHSAQTATSAATAATQATAPIRLHLAAENMVDTLFDRRFEAGQLLTMVHHTLPEDTTPAAAATPGMPADTAPCFSADTIPGTAGDMLLVETSYFSPPMSFEDTLDEIRLKGLHPLLAHPERYVYMGRRDYERLKANGVLFQLNLMSLVGIYGNDAADKASRLLLDGMYDYAGSDLHRLSPWQRAISDPALTKKEIAALLKTAP